MCTVIIAAVAGNVMVSSSNLNTSIAAINNAFKKSANVLVSDSENNAVVSNYIHPVV